MHTSSPTMRATYLTHVKLLDLIILRVIILGEEYKI
jgi:hypothetical protein